MSSKERSDTSYRSEWPLGEIRGRFIFLQEAVFAVERFLPTYRGVDGDHEGIAFLCGFEVGETTIYTTALAPPAEHSRGRVWCREEHITVATQTARELGLGLLAQVHSHPGDGTGHSYGDDEMIFMPFDGMLSIVVPNYARFGLHPLDSLGVHQFQDGQWVLCRPDGVRNAISIAPAGVDLR
jgi:proteasome lid subunit RPN8/RPN11